MAVLNGFTPNTALNLQLDAGILVKNIVISDTFDITTITDENKIGATSGGASFTAEPNLRNIFEDLDGAKGNYKDGNVIDTWDITLSSTLKEITKENLKLAIGPSDVVTGMTYDKIVPRLDVNTNDYISNVCWLGTINNNASPIIIELKNAMNTNGLNFTASDKATGGIEVELKAHFDLTKAEEVPFVIHIPKSPVRSGLFTTGSSKRV